MTAMKLALRLREYDWMAAVVELVTVVVGVLIALQVSNWNQDRVDHARADGYQRRLHAELMADQRNVVCASTPASARTLQVRHRARRSTRDEASAGRMRDFFQKWQRQPRPRSACTFSALRRQELSVSGGHSVCAALPRLLKRKIPAGWPA
jgi:hypothetical protein